MRLLRRSVFVVSVLAFLSAVSSGVAESSPMPETVTFFDELYPGWVSAQKITTREGGLDTFLFRPNLAEQLSALLSLPEKDGCLRLGEVQIDRVAPPVRQNIAQAAGSASVVLIGRVTGLAPGIRELEAGTLIQVEPVEVLKGQHKILQQEYFLFMPIGDFKVGTRRICKTDPGYVSLPRTGDELMLFVVGMPQASVPFLDVLDGGGVVRLSGDSLELPVKYKGDPLIQGSDRRGLVALIKRLAPTLETDASSLL